VVWSFVVFGCLSLTVRGEDVADFMRIELAMSYVQGYGEIWDWKKANGYSSSEDHGSDPIGPVINTSFDFGNGFFVWGGLGPGFIIGDYFEITVLPVNLGAGYSFNPEGSISPYVKLGGRYMIADGDYIGISTPGIQAAAGLQFRRQKLFGFFMEIGFDTSTIEMTNKNDPYRPMETPSSTDTIMNGFNASVGLVVRP